MAFDSLLLQAAEEGLCYRIVPTIAAPTHAVYQVVVLAPAGEVVTAKLASLVGMNHYRGFGAPAPDGHRECVQHQFGGHGGVH